MEKEIPNYQEFLNTLRDADKADLIKLLKAEKFLMSFFESEHGPTTIFYTHLGDEEGYGNIDIRYCSRTGFYSDPTKLLTIWEVFDEIKQPHYTVGFLGKRHYTVNDFLRNFKPDMVGIGSKQEKNIQEKLVEESVEREVTAEDLSNLKENLEKNYQETLRKLNQDKGK